MQITASALSDMYPVSRALEYARDFRHAHRQMSLRKKFLDQRPSKLYGTFFGTLFAPEKTILFTPQTPSPGYVIYKLCALAGYKIIHDPCRRYDLAFKFHDSTVTSPEFRACIPEEMPVINGSSLDISKQQVGKTLEKVFGYSLLIDPLTYRRTALMKSNGNSTHDGHIVECPLSSARDLSRGTICEKMIDNSTPDGYYLDYRAPVFGKTIPLVYMKYRKPEDRFTTPSRSRTVTPRSVFSSEEIRRIIVFAREMGIDYGELDILRDNADGRLYIVDANNTPFGPHHGFTLKQQQAVLPILARNLKTLVTSFLSKNAAAD